MNRKRLWLAFTALGVVAAALLLFLWLRGRVETPIHPKGAGPYQENPAPALTGNANLRANTFLTQAEVEAASQLPAGAQRLSLQLMRWSEHIRQDEGGKVTSYYVAPDRMVWVVKESHPSYAFRHGVMTNAVVTNVYDAATGRLLHLQARGRPELLGVPQ